MSSTPAVLLNRDHPALVRFRHAEKTVQITGARQSAAGHYFLFGSTPSSEAELEADDLAYAGLTADERSLVDSYERYIAAEAADKCAQAQWLAQHNKCTAAIKALYALNLSAVAAALVAELEEHLALVAGLEHADDPPPPLHRSPIRTCHATTGPPRQDRRCTSTELGSGRLVATKGRKRAT
jgi:hypothetical protein